MFEMKVSQIFGILNQSAKTINLYRAFNEDLKNICTSTGLTESLNEEMKWEENYIKKTLGSYDDKDRALIVSLAFDNIEKLQNEEYTQPASIFEDELNASKTLIEMNNDVTFSRCFARSPEKTQEQLSILPPNQLESFSTYLNEMVEEYGKKYENIEDNDCYTVLTNLNTTVQNFSASTEQAQ